LGGKYLLGNKQYLPIYDFPFYVMMTRIIFCGKKIRKDKMRKEDAKRHRQRAKKSKEAKTA
jgi:hypothetical protein